MQLLSANANRMPADDILICRGQRLERMRGDLHFIGVPASNQHAVFVDSASEARAFSATKHFDTPEELLDRSFNRPRQAQLDAGVQGLSRKRTST